MRTHVWFFVVAGLIASVTANTDAARFVFDAGHAQSAGNADWVVDADLHNIDWTSSGTFSFSGNESNPQRIPTPAASGITGSTTETFWNGALSAWAVDLVKRGHSVETLPPGSHITFGTTNSQDLTQYDVVVIDEPNILFTTTEKQALVNFVSAGGGLFMIADHLMSDRDGNGKDSVDVWNDFSTNNGLTNNPFGVTYVITGSGTDTSGVNSRFNSTPGNPICFGPLGTATNILYSGGNEFQIDPTKNGTVTAYLWFGTTSQSNSFCALATSRYGNGRVVMCGDSSPFEDGTGDPNDTLFNGYTGDINGKHRPLILNCSEWLATPPSVTATAVVTAVAIEGNNVRLTWNTTGSKTNFVQATAGIAGNFTTNGFTDISPAIVAPGTSTVTTNYLDLNAATNSPARYYRIRLAP